MVRTWLNGLGKKWFSGKPKSQRIRSGRVRLEVESLGARVVPAQNLSSVSIVPVDGQYPTTMMAGTQLPVKVTAKNDSVYTYNNGYTGEVYINVLDSNGARETTIDYTMQNGKVQTASGDVLNVTIGKYSLQLAINRFGVPMPAQQAYIDSQALKVKVTPGTATSFELTHLDGTAFASTISRVVGASTPVMITAYDAGGNITPVALLLST